MTEVSFIVTNSFLNAWISEGLTEHDLKELEYEIAYFHTNQPDNSFGRGFPGDILRKTGGAIKLRFAPKDTNKGKSGSYRIIYCLVKHNRVYFLTVYKKGRQDALSDLENNQLKKLIQELHDRFGGKQNG